MWSRSGLKTQAKSYLKHNYINAFVISLILMIVGGNASSNQSIFKFSNDQTGGQWHSFMTGIMIATAIAAVMAGIVIILLGIFIGGPLEVGGRRYYINTTQGDESDFRVLTSVFGNDDYINVVKVMFFTKLYVFLWFLALIVPGIIKYYAYSMVPYILAEEPDMTLNEALMLSEDMTYTHKMDMFLLDVSFIGWYILGGLFFGIGQVFVNPYVDATKAYLYEALKEQAREDGFY